MSRNHYEAAFGVCRVEWHAGQPARSEWPLLVEVWRPNLVATDPTWNAPTRPAVHIAATIEVRMYVNGAWKVVGYNGTLRDPEGGEVRRWASFRSRAWAKAITLDGWDPLPSTGGETNG